MRRTMSIVVLVVLSTATVTVLAPTTLAQININSKVGPITHKQLNTLISHEATENINVILAKNWGPPVSGTWSGSVTISGWSLTFSGTANGQNAQITETGTMSEASALSETATWTDTGTVGGEAITGNGTVTVTGERVNGTQVFGRVVSGSRPPTCNTCEEFAWGELLAAATAPEASPVIGLVSLGYLFSHSSWFDDSVFDPTTGNVSGAGVQGQQLTTVQAGTLSSTGAISYNVQTPVSGGPATKPIRVTANQELNTVISLEATQNINMSLANQLGPPVSGTWSGSVTSSGWSLTLAGTANGQNAQITETGTLGGETATWTDTGTVAGNTVTGSGTVTVTGSEVIGSQTFSGDRTVIQWTEKYLFPPCPYGSCAAVLFSKVLEPWPYTVENQLDSTTGTVFGEAVQSPQLIMLQEGSLASTGAISFNVQSLTSSTSSMTAANEFVAGASGSISQIDIGIGTVLGANSFFVALYEASGGEPGTLIGQWSNLTATETFGQCCGLVTISGISGVSVVAGTSYFLVLGPTNLDSSTSDMWNLNSTGVTGTDLYATSGCQNGSGNGCSWNSNGTQTLGAFDIIGTTGCCQRLPGGTTFFSDLGTGTNVYQCCAGWPVSGSGAGSPQSLITGQKK